MKSKLLLDTDIGTDIDDAVCLAYLLAQPACHLVGITTVTGAAEDRARMASALCQLAGKHVPVFPGVEKPLLVPPQQQTAPQASVLAKWPHQTTFPMGGAVDFMRQVIRESPGEITLLCIGPLTNAALLFSLDPEIPLLLKELVIMGGSYGRRWGKLAKPEWNIRLDPHAAAVVFGAKLPGHKSFGLNITSQVRLSASEVRRRFRGPLLELVLDFASVWFQNREEIIFHDPLAASALFDEQICSFARGSVEVRLEPGKRLGQTRWHPGADGQHQAAMAVDRDRFFDHFFSQF